MNAATESLKTRIRKRLKRFKVECGGFKVPYVGNWQAAEDMPRFSSPTDRAYCCEEWPAFVRDARPCDEVARGIRHTGWYTGAYENGESDPDSGSLRGYVLRLTGRDRKEQFIPGTAHSDYDGVTLYPLAIYDDESECAHIADEFARIAAEHEREYQAEESRKYIAQEKREEIVTIRADIRALLRELKAARRAGVEQFPTICKALRADIAALRRDSAKCFRRIRELEA